MIRLFCRFEVAGAVRWSMSALVCAIPTMRISMAALGRAARNAVIFGRHEMTKPMRKTRSIGQNTEGDGDKVQIPGTKIDLQRSFLDTLSELSCMTSVVAFCPQSTNGW